MSLTLAMAWPLVRGISSTIANYGDPLLNSWILAWDAHQLVANPLHLFDANIFYPYPATLAYSEHLLGIAVLAAPLQWATGNAVLVHNLAILFSFVMAATGACLLARYLTGSWYGGLLAGMAFGFAGYRFSEFGQLQNVTAQWLPFTFLYLARFFRTRGRRDAALFALFGGLQLLSNVYYAFYTLIALALYLGYRLILAWRERRSDLDRTLWGRLLVALGALLLLLVLVFLPYMTARAAVGDRGLSSQDGASLRDFLNVPAASLLGRLVPALGVAPDAGKTYFPGALTLALAATALARRRPPQGQTVRTEPFFYVGLACAGFVLALGPDLRLVPGGPVAWQPMPYAFLLRWLPGFSAMRVPARMAILVIFACSVLAGFGGASLARHWSGPPGNSRPAGPLRSRLASWPSVLLGAVLLLQLACYLAWPLAGQPIPAGEQAPEVYRWLKGAPANSVTVELPTPTTLSVWQDETAMMRMARQEYYSTYHWQPMILGYSGFYPPLHWSTVERLLRFPSSETLSYLRGLHVRYVVLHAADYPAEAWAALTARLPQFADQLSLERQFGSDYVYRLQDAGAAADVHYDLLLPAPSAADGEYLAYLITDNPSTVGLVRPLAQKYTITYRWAGSQAGQTQTGSLPLAQPAGASFIPVVLSPAPPFEGQELVATLTVGTQTVTRTARLALGKETLLENGARHYYHPAGFNLGGQVQLLGAALDSQSYQVGDAVAVTLYWRRLAKGPAPAYVLNFNVADGSGGHSVVAVDTPLDGLASWPAGETAVQTRIEQLPVDLAPGRYQLAISLYDTGAQQFVPVILSDGSQKWDALRMSFTVN